MLNVQVRTQNRFAFIVSVGLFDNKFLGYLIYADMLLTISQLLRGATIAYLDKVPLTVLKRFLQKRTVSRFDAFTQRHNFF